MFESHRKFTVAALLAAALSPLPASTLLACPRGGRGGYRGGIRLPLPIPLYSRNKIKSRQPSNLPATVIVVREQPAPAAPAQSGSAQSRPAPAPAAESPTVDLQFVELRLVDAGDAVLELGPTYRAIVRNGGKRDATAFHVSLVVAGDRPRDAAPVRATEEVASLAPGAECGVSLSLPYSASLNENDVRLLVQVDSRQEVAELDEANNLAEATPRQVRPLGPVVGVVTPRAPRAGDELVLEGEALGEQSGTVHVTLGGIKLAAEVIDWLPSRVTVRLPRAVLEQPAASRIALTRADGQCAASVDVEIHPAAQAASSVASR